MRAVDIAVELGKANTDRQRDAAVRRAWNECEEFFLGLQMSVDPEARPPLPSVPQFEEEDDGFAGSFTFAEFTAIWAIITAPSCTAEAAKEIVWEAAERANVTEWNQWYRRILLKTLHTTLPMDRVAHVLKELTA
jgi:hypothetical protein